MPELEPRHVIIRRGEPPMRIELPDGIGYVEIRTTGVHGATGYPVIGVEVVSETQHTDAADGRRYYFQSSAHGGVLIGEPGPQMIARERLAQELAHVIKAHDAGDHSLCPATCPAATAPGESS